MRQDDWLRTNKRQSAQFVLKVLSARLTSRYINDYPGDRAMSTTMTERGVHSNILQQQLVVFGCASVLLPQIGAHKPHDLKGMGKYIKRA